jgi:perosamine synthetase
MKYPVAKPVFHGNERKYLLQAFDSTWISSRGEFIDKFESEFAAFCGVKHALTCSNGTAALHLSLLAIDIGPGDEVILPTFTYVATANAVRYCGATPVLVDCHSDTWNIDETLIEKAITKRTKAIIVVHIYGHPCEMAPIQKIAEKHNLKIIEDAAEAHGAAYFNPQQTKTGALGDIAAFSLFGNKIITSGEGGVITINDSGLAEKIKLLKDQGMSPTQRYWFPIVGYNYRMTNLQAAIALAQLENIDWHMERRRKIVDTYNNYLAASKFINIPVERNNVRHAYWMYSIALTKQCALTRDDVITKLTKVGVESRPFFCPVHRLPPYYNSKNADNYPVADEISSRGLNLPTYSDLSENSIGKICDVLLHIVQC